MADASFKSKNKRLTTIEYFISFPLQEERLGGASIPIPYFATCDKWLIFQPLIL